MTAALKWLALVIALVLLGVAGTMRSLPRYNTPRSYRLLLVSGTKGHYTVEVQASRTLSFQVSNEGRVTLDVPTLPRTCNWDWFCFTIVDGSPETRRLISVLRDGRAIRRYSIAELERLERMTTGADGTIRLKF